jgi:predicted membrane-bound mannosyltransferase
MVKAVMPEAGMWKPVRESGVRKGRTRKTATREMAATKTATSNKMVATKMRASAHATEMGPAAHCTDAHSTSHSSAVHPTSHSSAMHPTSHSASHSTSMPTSSHPATAAAECRRGKSKRGREGARDEAIKDLVVHPNSSWLNQSDEFSRNEKTPSRAKGSDVFRWQMWQFLTRKLDSPAQQKLSESSHNR